MVAVHGGHPSGRHGGDIKKRPIRRFVIFFESFARVVITSIPYGCPSPRRFGRHRHPCRPSRPRRGTEPPLLEAVTVVSAAGFEQHIADAPASISVIDREQLETRSYTDVTDALKDIPGVTVTGGGSRQDISLRGMSPKYTMILVDGRRLSGREATA